MVEDSDEEATILLDHLEHYGKVHGVRFITTRSVTAFELVNDAIQADLVFMDIDLPGINGMEAAEMLRESDTTTPLIFVTNLAQYAVRGYQVDALDFMVKPIAYGDFSMRMDRAMRAVKKNAGRTVAFPPLAECDSLRLMTSSMSSCPSTTSCSICTESKGAFGDEAA